MANVDDKVVAISFENDKFQTGVAETISSLDRLKAALHFPTAGKGLDEITNSASKVDLSPIASGIEGIQEKLGALRLIAISVFADLAKKAISAGTSLVKALTIDPMKEGFNEYQTNLNSIQTILANTQAAGTTLKDVNAALKELNVYSDKTIYNFAQMARNIGTFTAAGVDLKTSTASIKGIANLAALSGSNAEQASRAMYQLSQALSSGVVRLQDWMSVEKTGMGGTVFQRALTETAEQVGTLKKGLVELKGPMKNVTVAGQSFRNSLSMKDKKTGQSWLTTEVLTKTLKHFTGDLTDAQLKAEGYTAAQIKSIQQMAKTAMQAATVVKTFPQLIDVAKEALGTGWADTWSIVLGDFGEAKKTWTELSLGIGKVIDASSAARNKMLGDWKALGGRVVLIQSIRQVLENLGKAIVPIKEAFREMFPAITGKNLFDLTQKFERFSRALKPGKETIDNLKRTFKGLFAILDIGKQIIQGIFSVFGRLFSSLTAGRGGFLSFTATIGDFLVKIDESLKKGDRLHRFFLTLGDVLAAPLKIIIAIGAAFKKLFAGFKAAPFNTQMNAMTDAMSPFAQILNAVADAWGNFTKSFGGGKGLVQTAVEGIVNLITGLGTALGQAASSMSFEPILAVIRTGFLGGLVLMFHKFLGKGSAIDQITKGFGGGILSNISGSFKALEGSMKSMQQNIKAKTMKEIAIAVGILAASMLALSLIKPERLSGALAAMTVGMGELVGSMYLLTKMVATKGFIQLPLITGSMFLLAAAMDALALAVMALSRLSWSELIRGLAGVGASLLIMIKAVGPLSANSAGMIRAGIGLMAVATGLRIMASAISAMGSMDLRTLATGLGGVATALLVLVKGMSAMPAKGMIQAGIGLIAIAVGLRIIANAMAKMGSMSFKDLAKGMYGFAVALSGIVIAINALPKNAAVRAAGLLVVAVAMEAIADAVTRMGGQSLGTLAKGLISFAIALFMLNTALIAMEASIPGAKALAIAAAGIALLAPAIVMMGKQKISTLVKGLVVLAAALVIVGAAGMLIEPALPGLIGLGVALVLIGGAIALVGAGIFLISAGISALIVALPTGVGVLVAAFNELIQGLIKSVKQLVLGLLIIVEEIAKVAPKFVDAFVKIIISLLDGIIKAAPKFAEAFIALIDMALSVIGAKQDQIVEAGYQLLLSLLKGLKGHMSELVAAVTGIIVEFLNAISKKIRDIVNAGANILISLLKGVASVYRKVAVAALDIVASFITAIGSGYGRIVTAGLNVLLKFLNGIANALPRVIKAAVNIIVQLVNTIGEEGPRLIRAGVNAATKFVNSLAKEIPRLADNVAKALITLINSMATVIETNAGPLRSAGLHLGYAIIDGMTGGLLSKAKGLYTDISNIMGKAKSLMHVPWKSKSPSRVMIDLGKNIMDGMTIGLEKNAKDTYKAAESVSNGVIGRFTDTFQIQSPSKVMIKIGQEVGKGFAVGIKGSRDDIKKAFDDMDSLLVDSMTKARETIASEQEKLKKLQEAKKPDQAAIKAAQKVILENENILKRSTEGHIVLTKTLSKQKAVLMGLADDYDKIGVRLKDARDKLKEAQSALTATFEEYKAQYSDLPTITDAFDADKNPVDQLAVYLKDLQGQVDAVGAYDSTLKQLRALGIDKETYEKLLKEGTADQSFANQLLAGGKTAVEGLNKLDAQLKKNSGSLATAAAENLKRAGVTSAQGLVKGLESQEQAIENKMTHIGQLMVKALKRELGIKSPSRIFAEMGGYVMEGFAQGITSGSKMVEDAVDGAAKKALDAMKKNMQGIANAVTDNLDTNPVITPILDLTTVKTQAQELAAMTNVTPITAAASYGQASSISAASAASQEEALLAAPGASVKFEQNNYSPESLSEVEIYRQTKNQLSQLKSVLALT